jgi:hypothetical protein
MSRRTARQLIAALRAIEWVENPAPTIENYQRAPFCLTDDGLRRHLAADALATAIGRLIGDALAVVLDRRPALADQPVDEVLAAIVDAVGFDRAVAAAVATAASRAARKEARERRSALARELRDRGLTYTEIGEEIARREGRRERSDSGPVVPYSRDTVRRWLRRHTAE